MSYQALLFCPDEKTARVVTEVLTELDFTVEPCTETFSAVKKLMGQHFDAVVVDCDNEQNATLLFKSARNSAPNQSSLAVAVVEGQTGVAKAFRIGANLVLTKPINVEQAKGTLRVARGLLRKAEASKPESHGPHIVPSPVTNFDSARPKTTSSFSETSSEKTIAPFASMNAAHAPGSPEVSAAGFELEEDEGPKPEAAEVALLESMQDPLTTSGKSGQASPFASQERTWQPGPTTAPIEEFGGRNPQSKTLGRQDKTAVQALGFGALKNSSNAPAASSTSNAGAAVAPARTKEPSHTVDKTVESKSEAGEIDAGLAPAVQMPELPHSAADPQTKSGGSKKVLLYVVAAMLLVAIGYVGWTRMRPAVQEPPIQQTAVPAPAPVPTPVPAVDATTGPDSSSTTAKAESLPAVENDAAHPAAASAAPPSPKPTTATQTLAGIPASTTVQPALTGPSTSRLIVVKSADVAPTASQPVAPETVQPTAPGALGIAANSDERAITRIVNSAPVRVPVQAPKRLRISQGVSQGLLARRVQPTYPAQALQMHLQGEVLLEAKIGKDGSIVSVKRVSGDALLARAATDAVKQWKYKPYYLNGEPVEIDTEISVNFKLP